MDADKVRLTVQLRDEKNNIRFTVHADVDVKDMGERSGDIGERLAKFYKQEKSQLKYGTRNGKAKGASA